MNAQKKREEERVMDDDVDGGVGEDEGLYPTEGSSSVQDERSESRGLWHDTIIKALSADLARAERVRSVLEDQFHAVSQVTRYLIPVTIVVLMWHHILPEWAGWLTDKQVVGIRWILVGGIGLGSVSGFVYKYTKSGRMSGTDATGRTGL